MSNTFPCPLATTSFLLAVVLPSRPLAPQLGTQQTLRVGMKAIKLEPEKDVLVFMLWHRYL